MKKKVNFIKSEEGFTLIEVIAVLIILGILAAVAVPRYFDLAEDAEKKRTKAVQAEGLGMVNLAYGKLALQQRKEPSMADLATELNNNAKFSGDFVFAFTATEEVAADGTGGKIEIDINIKEDRGTGVQEYDFTIVEWLRP